MTLENQNRFVELAEMEELTAAEKRELQQLADEFRGEVRAMFHSL